ALIAMNGLYYQAYTLVNIAKALGTIGIGWLGYGLILRHFKLNLPRILEQLEHLIGVMSLMLILLFWMVWA
ncbi:MAG: cation:proton antiporter, partial [Acaryochloris sp. SU_5_25]|nr:cation:proton antiporter [Acaryochloris sp. SU_5_25]